MRPRPLLRATRCPRVPQTRANSTRCATLARKSAGAQRGGSANPPHHSAHNSPPCTRAGAMGKGKGKGKGLASIVRRCLASQVFRDLGVETIPTHTVPGPSTFHAGGDQQWVAGANHIARVRAENIDSAERECPPHQFSAQQPIGQGLTPENVPKVLTLLCVSHALHVPQARGQLRRRGAPHEVLCWDREGGPARRRRPRVP